MSTVAIVGAGDLGGAVARALASRDRVRRILLIDDDANVARGKALDLRQSAAIERFHTTLDGTGDLSRVTGCAACIVADRVADGSEWRGEEALAMLQHLKRYLGEAPLVFAGSSHADLLAAASREAAIPRHRLIGSATEAFASAARSIVAVEARCSARDVALTVLGLPSARLVVPWGEAAISGYALERTLDQVQVNRLEARLASLWPPGVSTLGTAAARVCEAIVQTSRAWYAVLTVLAGEFGVSDRVATLPALLSTTGIVHTRTPLLNTRDRVMLGI